jgi:hypothetical protein
MSQQIVSEKRWSKIHVKCQEMRSNARVEPTEPCSFCAKHSKMPYTDDTVWMATENVIFVSVKVTGLHQLNRKIISEVPPYCHFTNKLKTPATSARCVSVPCINPEQVDNDRWS